MRIVVTAKLLLAAALVIAGLGPSSASLAQQKPEKLTILSHRVHMSVAQGTQGGNITEEWSKRNGVQLEWVTLDTGPLHERMFREASLGQTGIDIAFLLNTRAVPNVATLFEPLDEHQQRDAIDEFGDIFPGLVSALRFDGKLYGIPFRHATTGLHYNQALFAERGVSGPPKTMEEFVEIAKKLTYTRADGTQVFGFVIEGDNYPNVIDIARGWDGDFITQDFKVVANQPPMVRAVGIMRDFYAAGVLPRNWPTLKTEEVNTWMQTGRAAMTINSLGRNQFYNDPEKSKFAGQIKATTMPIGSELAGKFEVAPAKTEFWSMVIPKNSRNKQLAWSLVKEMASKENTLKAALNGNGPVRNSTYTEAAFAEKIPYAQDEARVLRVARVPLPAFDNAAKAGDIFVEEMQAAILGRKPPQQAMDDVVRRVQPLLP